MATRIMLDLETLGTKPGSVIVAIGAVKFGEGTIHDRFYERVDAQSCVTLGLKMDVFTVRWWMKQSEEARTELLQPGTHLSKALLRFSEWIGLDWQDVEIWGNGSDFDNPMLAAAYDAAGVNTPWKFWNNRCYRTLKNLFPLVPMHRSGTHHHGLHDAESQAYHLMDILATLK